MSNLSNKTIRPGSLSGYSYYYSKRRPATPPPRAKAVKKSRSKAPLITLLIVSAAAIGFVQAGRGAIQPSPSQQDAPVIAAANNQTNPCDDNTLNKLIKVSVSNRRQWACEGSKVVHQNAVITGLRHHPETETPVGTYKIYGKLTNTTLKGSDSRGSWSDPVYYWMPFLDNQYGTYGFHDATWRKNSEFGKVSPDSQDASHGCVELPLNDSKWFYEWAEVGTTVTVES